MRGLQLNQVFAGYGTSRTRTDVLKDPSVGISEGHIVCILGENGSGKSTLLRVLAGTLPYRGSIRLGEDELSRMNRKQISNQIAFMTQFSTVYFSYSVWETVMLGRYLKMNRFLGTPSKTDRQRVAECLEETGLMELKNAALGELSGGQLQRVFLARTFAQDTPYLLLDEPTNHLDLKYQSQLARYLQNWAGAERQYADGSIHRSTLIGVFHDINLAMQIADELIVMKDGRILAWGSKSQILQTDALQQAYGMDVSAYMKKQLAIWNESGE